jgi:glycosyltransferase involved in cell wall biosynthesis
MKSPFFSVIIPTFNREAKLPICLKSVLSQTFTDFEIVITDNGSTDNTEKMLLAEYENSRIQYYWQEGSGSPASPRNLGIRKARGVWVAFLDSDDVWYPEKLENVYKKIQVCYETDVICHNERMFDQTNQMTQNISHVRKAKDMYKSMLLEGNCLSPSATTIRKSFLTGKKLYFNESSDFAIVEDYDLWLRLAKNGAVISFIDKTLGDYVVDGGNMVGDWRRYIKNLENLYRHHAFFVQDFEQEKDKIYEQLIAKIHFQKMMRAMKERKLSEFIYEFFQTFRKSPTLLPGKIISKASLAFDTSRI